MSKPTSNVPKPDPASNTEPLDTASWPWQCVGCGTTIYHDGDYCRDCESATTSARRGPLLRNLREFVGWMRGQPYRTFVPTVTLITFLELALTALWLELVLLGPSELLRIAPFFA